MRRANRKIYAIIAVLSIALVFCFAALIGFSFAWFVQSDVLSSSISVGAIKLNVTGYGKSEAILYFDNAEPGMEYVGYFDIENAGDVAFSCTLSVDIEEDRKIVDGGEEETNLADELYVSILELTESNADVGDSQNVIKRYDAGTLTSLASLGFTFCGDVTTSTSRYFAAVIEFDASASNAYEGAEVSFTMTVTATQVA